LALNKILESLIVPQIPIAWCRGLVPDLVIYFKMVSLRKCIGRVIRKVIGFNLVW